MDFVTLREVEMLLVSLHEAFDIRDFHCSSAQADKF